MTTIILNFKDLNEQFPWGDPSLIGAMELQGRLDKLVVKSTKENILNIVYSIPCNEKSEAEAQFELEGKVGNTVLFNYIGTAN